MKQKIVVKLFLRCGKCRKEAMKIAAGANGVSSVAIQGENKDELVVVGIDVDAADLCAALRKKVKSANLVSVEEVKPPKPEDNKKKEGEKTEQKKTEKTEEKKKDGDQDKKKEQTKDEAKKPESESKPAPPTPPPAYVYPPYPPPHYHCQNPQFYVCTLPPEENQGCVVM